MLKKKHSHSASPKKNVTQNKKYIRPEKTISKGMRGFKEFSACTRSAQPPSKLKWFTSNVLSGFCSVRMKLTISAKPEGCRYILKQIRKRQRAENVHNITQYLAHLLYHANCFVRNKLKKLVTALSRNVDIITRTFCILFSHCYYHVYLQIIVLLPSSKPLCSLFQQTITRFMTGFVLIMF